MTVATTVPGRYIGISSPSEAGPQTEWIDTSLAGSRFPGHPGRSWVIADLGSSAPSQEPNLVVNPVDGKVYLFCNQGGNLVLYTTTNPNDPTGRSWTKIGIVMGSGVGGEAQSVIHPGKLVEGNTLYIYYCPTSGTTTVKVASATMAALAANPLTAFGGQATVFSKAGGVVPGLTQFGNFMCIKIGSTYRLYIEGQGTNTDSWQTMCAECATPTGTFVSRTGILASLDPALVFGTNKDNPVPTNISSLQMYNFRSYSSCGPIVFENGQYVMLVHAGPFGSAEGAPQSDIYKAFSPDGIDFYIDLQAYPCYSRMDHRWELDQVADIEVVDLTGYGDWLAVWTAANNNTGNSRFLLKSCMLSPTAKKWNGFGWTIIDQDAPPTLQRQLIRVPNMNDSATVIKPFDDFTFNAGAGTSTLILPSMGVGVRCAVSNNSTTATGCVALTCPAGNAFVNGATTFYIPYGQRVEFNVAYELSGIGQVVASQPSRVVGTATLVAGAVTVSDTRVTANAQISLSTNAVGGTPGALYVSAKTVNTSFVITSTNAGDTSTVNWTMTFP
jgi:hypothetical protein